jgi:rifampicin phosphotransferase
VPTAPWVIRQEPSSTFPLYTRGNVQEVFGNVVTPLTASLFSDTVRRVFIDTFESFGVLSKRERGEADAPVSGFFWGYLYLNLSIGRIIGARTPGVKPSDIDVLMFGTYGAPEYTPQPGDRNLRASFALMRSAVALTRRHHLDELEQARHDSNRFIAALPDVATATDEELLGAVDTFQQPYYDDFVRLSSCSTAATSGRLMVERILAFRRSQDPSAMVNALTSGIGAIDSAGLALRLWDLGRLVAADDGLGLEFDSGLDGLLARLRDDPTSGHFVAEFDRFLADHGHRCADEYELAVSSWSTDPRPALAAIDRLRSAPDDRSPHRARQRIRDDRSAAEREASAMVPRIAHPMLRRGIRLAHEGAEARERAKDVFVRDIAAMRLVVAELLKRAQSRGGPPLHRDCYLVTIDELADFVRDPVPYAASIAERAALRDYLQDRIPPFWFDGLIPDPSTWELRPTLAETTSAIGTLTGLGVCNGIAVGPARVVLDPSDARGLQSGDVLVAPFTDPAWTPLFLGACAVVVDIGAQLSHAAIIARELGIPAVVSVTGASVNIADGTMLRVDGGAGIVEIL